jgi:serine protease Do
MKRILLVALLIPAVFATPLLAQLRMVVPVVRPVLHPRTIEFLTSLSESMRRDGYQDAADMLKGYASGGFGSGFVFVAPDGANYVVTNRHVVAQAGSVTLEFERDDGSSTVYRECRVLMVDEALDLALVSFPPAIRPFTKSIPLSTQAIEDGADVWSAGFPAVIDRPTWQLGKGNITNNRARVPELADPAITTLLQHSAQVDAGNSGGPLVVADPAAPGGYQVIGVNTWKIIGRQAANFAIPAAAIDAFIQRALIPASTTVESLSAALEARSRDLIGALNLTGEDSYRNLARFISYELASRDGEATLKDVLATAPTRVRDDIIEEFSSVSPVEGIRMAIGYSIRQAFTAEAAGALAFLAIDGNPADTSSPVPVRLRGKDGDIPTSWMREHGTWRLAAIPNAAERTADKKEKKGEAGSRIVDLDAPYRLQIKAEGALLIASPPWIHGGAGLVFAISDFMALGLDARVGQVETQDMYGSPCVATIVHSLLYGRLQIPVQFQKISIIPYLLSGVSYIAGIGIDTSIVIPSGGVAYGIGVEACLGSNPSYSFGLEWQGENDLWSGVGTNYAGLFVGFGW